EEVETLNEEMQATGEELETLNEELQATVEELNTTNEELIARGADLERQAAERAAEVALNQALIALFADAFRGVPMPAAVLDGQSTILATTAEYDALAAENDGTLALKGARLTTRPKSLKLARHGREVRYAVSFSDGSSAGVLLTLLAADYQS
ncbi:MAG: hypothetical protein JOY69_00540, partial [Candidatus Eremiobacteraeota bacterium]|nr:hypothetical protein [Candidatus Eremiobacteraeota bacterium]